MSFYLATVANGICVCTSVNITVRRHIRKNGRRKRESAAALVLWCSARSVRSRVAHRRTCNEIVTGNGEPGINNRNPFPARRGGRPLALARLRSPILIYRSPTTAFVFLRSHVRLHTQPVLLRVHIRSACAAAACARLPARYDTFPRITTRVCSPIYHV